jgi:hypothetical protein
MACPTVCPGGNAESGLHYAGPSIHDHCIGTTANLVTQLSNDAKDCLTTTILYWNTGVKQLANDGQRITNDNVARSLSLFTIHHSIVART